VDNFVDYVHKGRLFIYIHVYKAISVKSLCASFKYSAPISEFKQNLRIFYMDFISLCYI